MPEPTLRVQIKKEFRVNGRVAFSLDARFVVRQEITVLFGPSGSGKTTILRSIAGIVAPDSGRIEFGDRVYFDSAIGADVPIQRRRVGFVFQDYLLFPHLTACENVSYGIRPSAAKSRHDRAHELLELLGIGYAADRRPQQLSGGEQQRVTLARALASDPTILLLDEPMSALDAGTRLRLLQEMAGLQRKLRIPFLYVTHSPADAVRMGDSALVLNAGRIVQAGTPAEVINAPRDWEVAQTVGCENILAGTIRDHNEREGITLVDLNGCQLVIPYNALPKAAAVTIGLRADEIIVSREKIAKTSARNLLEGTITRIMQDGPSVDLLTNCGVDLRVRVTSQALEVLDLRPGARVYLLIKANSCHLLP